MYVVVILDKYTWNREMYGKRELINSLFLSLGLPVINFRHCMQRTKKYSPVEHTFIFNTSGMNNR